jgi:hypothetical protein
MINMKNISHSTRFRNIVRLSGVFFVLFLPVRQDCFSQTNNARPEIMYQEELTVLTDRDIYIAGEKIYLKIYKLNRLYHLPDNVSKIVYSQLIDSYKNPVAQVKLKISGNSGTGEIAIPDTIPTGNYLLCSCTSWMQNFSPELYSYKRISVINPFKNFAPVKILLTDQQPDSIAFYPESGHIISGLDNFIGCRGYNQRGFPVSFHGYITGDSGTKHEIKAGNDGICFFSLKPKPGENLFLVTENGEGKSKKFSIPSADDYGTNLNIKTDNNNLIVRIQRRQNPDIINNKFLIQYSAISGELLRKRILASDTLIVMSKNTLPAGLASISISDNNDKILAKRWIFNDRGPVLTCNVNLQNAVYYTRDLVKLTVDADDISGAPLSGDLMVSVVKSFSLDKSNTGNRPEYSQLSFLASVATESGSTSINDYLVLYPLLNDLFTENDTVDNQINDVKSLVEEQKNSPPDESIAIDIQNGILPGVNESYREGKKGSDDYFHMPELEGLIVSGRILNTETGDPLKNENVILSFVGNTANCSFAKTKKNGVFYFETRGSGLREIVIQPIMPCPDGYYVEMNNPFPEKVSKQKMPCYSPDTNSLSLLNKAIISMQVQGIFNPYKVADKMAAGDVTIPDFFGMPLETVYIKEYIDLSSLREVIKEVVPGLWIWQRDKKNYFKLASESDCLPFEKDPLVLVDGVPVDDIDKVLAINPGELEKIEIVRKRYYVSDMIFDGIIQFITRKANLSAMEFEHSLFRQEYQLVQFIPGFYSPDYSTDSLRNSRIPDFRNTLYWNPCLMTDKKGKATAEFFTSDEPGEYTVVVEGMSNEGKVVRTEKKFMVVNRK